MSKVEYPDDLLVTLFFVQPVISPTYTKFVASEQSAKPISTTVVQFGNVTESRYDPNFSAPVYILEPPSNSSQTAGAKNRTGIQTSDWQYGVAAESIVSTYDAAEMPTAGMHWTSGPEWAVFTFWVSSTTQDGWFVQDGYVYNGNPYPVCIITCLGGGVAPYSWIMFYTYCTPGCSSSIDYYGGVFSVPSGWSPGDHIYFSIAVYGPFNGHTSHGEISFYYDDHTVGKQFELVYCLGSSGPQKPFTGPVGGIAEDPGNDLQYSYGNIYVDQATLWAESLSANSRYSGNVNAYAAFGPPAGVKTYTYSANWGEFQVGFNKGTHITSGNLFTGASNLFLEDVPPYLNC